MRALRGTVRAEWVNTDQGVQWNQGVAVLAPMWEMRDVLRTFQPGGRPKQKRPLHDIGRRQQVRDIGDAGALGNDHRRRFRQRAGPGVLIVEAEGGARRDQHHQDADRDEDACAATHPVNSAS